MTHPITEDEIPCIVRSLRQPAGADPRFSTIDGLRRFRADFVPLVHATWKTLHNRALDELLNIEPIVRMPSSERLPRDFIWFLRRCMSIWRRVNDALVWSILGLDKGHFVRFLCHRKPRPVLSQANPESVRQSLNEVNSDPLSIALWTDATTCVDIGDLLCRSFSGGFSGFLEIKEGRVNHAVLKAFDAIGEILASKITDMKKGVQVLDALAEEYGQKAVKQLERVINQQQTLEQVLTILNTDEGFDPHFEVHAKVRQAKTPDDSYDDILNSLIERSRKEPVVEVIDRCLWVYIDRSSLIDQRELIERFSAKVFERAPHVRHWMAERYRSSLLEPVVPVDENLYEPTAVPLFFRAFDPVTIADLLLGDLRGRVLLYFDWVEYTNLVQEEGGQLTWSSPKAARAQQSRPRHKRAMIVGGRIPKISLPHGPSVTGHSKVSRVYFDGILPSIIAAQYVEMLQAQ
jgi:hypothetical protein